MTRLHHITRAPGRPRESRVAQFVSGFACGAFFGALVVIGAPILLANLPSQTNTNHEETTTDPIVIPRPRQLQPKASGAGGSHSHWRGCGDRSY